MTEMKETVRDVQITVHQCGLRLDQVREMRQYADVWATNLSCLVLIIGKPPKEYHTDGDRCLGNTV